MGGQAPPAGGGAGRGLARTEERGGAGRVQATNDEAALSKASAARAGYFADPYLGAFAPEAPARASLVNRCYHARVSAVRAVLRGFLEAGGGDGGAPPQVVSLGAGFGTDGFLALSEAWGGGAGLRWVDCDFPALARRKASAVRASHELCTLLRLPEAGDGGAEVAAAEASPRVLGSEEGYCLVGLDLRDLKAVEAALRDHGGVDFGRRTLILTECVLNYLTQRQGERVLAWAVRRFSRAVFVSYDQMLLRDAFGRAMAGCLRNRGSPLRGLDGGLGLPGAAPPPAEPETEAGALAGLRARFERQGWAACGAVSMSEVCRSFLPRVPAARFQEAQVLEAFDEFEEWDVQCAHYGLSWGLTPGAAADPVFLRALDRFPRPPGARGAPRAGPAGAAGAPAAPALRFQDPPPPEPPQQRKKAKRGAGRGGRRFGQASVGLPDGRVAVVGGFGCRCGPGGAQGRLGDVLVFDPFGVAGAPEEEPSWREVPCSGAPLRPRVGHAAAALSQREGLAGRLALFGGREAPGAPLGDLCLLDLSSGGGAEWRDLTSAAAEASPEGCTPTARWRHTLTNAGLSGRSDTDLLLLLGGWDGAAALGDAFVLQVGGGVPQGARQVSWSEVSLVGQVPAARFGHTVTRLGATPGPSGALDQRFVLFGGRDAARIFGDAFALTLVEPATGCGPWLLQCEELPSLSPPPPRYAHAACFLPDEGEADAPGSVLIVGGCTGAGEGPAAFRLSCSSWEWQELRVAGQLAGARQGDVLWARQGLHGAPRGGGVALVGGGGVCLGFGSHYNPLVLTGTLETCSRGLGGGAPE